MPGLTLERRQILTKFLRDDLELLAGGQELPTEPDFVTTGRAAQSLIVGFTLGNPVDGRRIVAKFVDPVEDKHIFEVNHQLLERDLPDHMPRPRGMDETVGLLVYDRLHNDRPLDLHWKENETSLDAHGPDVMERVLEVCGGLYSSGQMLDNPDGAHDMWGDSYAKLANKDTQDTIRSVLSSACPHVNWATDHPVPGSPMIGLPSELPNPFVFLKELLQRPVGRVWRSRVHGDLNLSNILVDSSFKAINIIDVSSGHSPKVTAVDLAQLECDLWQDVYATLAGRACGDAAALRHFIAIRNALDGYQDARALVLPLHRRYYRTVQRLRQKSQKLVFSTDASEFQQQYLTALYFAHMNAARYANIRDLARGGRELKVRLALAGASLCLRAVCPEASRGTDRSFDPLSDLLPAAQPPADVTNAARRLYDYNRSAAQHFSGGAAPLSDAGSLVPRLQEVPEDTEDPQRILLDASIALAVNTEVNEHLQLLHFCRQLEEIADDCIVASKLETEIPRQIKTIQRTHNELEISVGRSLQQFAADWCPDAEELAADFCGKIREIVEYRTSALAASDQVAIFRLLCNEAASKANALALRFESSIQLREKPPRIDAQVCYAVDLRAYTARLLDWGGCSSRGSNP